MTNLPYLTVYKGDFLRSNVSACSIAAQGLWFRIMILMHDSERAGYLCLNGEAMPSRIADIKCAVSVDEYETLLAELKSVCAFNTSREGIIFSPEIVAQAEDRSKNAERQRKFKEKRSGNGEGNGKVTPQVTEKSHPSSSSLSSSSSTSLKKNTHTPRASGFSFTEIGTMTGISADQLIDVDTTFRDRCVDGFKTRLKTPNALPQEFDYLKLFDLWERNEYTPENLLQTYDLLEAIRLAKGASWQVTPKTLEKNLGKIESLKQELQKITENQNNGIGKATTIGTVDLDRFDSPTFN
jgi:hypothetical protein